MPTNSSSPQTHFFSLAICYYLETITRRIEKKGQAMVGNSKQYFGSAVKLVAFVAVCVLSSTGISGEDPKNPFPSSADPNLFNPAAVDSEVEVVVEDPTPNALTPVAKSALGDAHKAPTSENGLAAPRDIIKVRNQAMGSRMAPGSGTVGQIQSSASGKESRSNNVESIH
jgi:hypothetical protein